MFSEIEWIEWIFREKDTSQAIHELNQYCISCAYVGNDDGRPVKTLARLQKQMSPELLKLIRQKILSHKLKTGQMSKAIANNYKQMFNL